MKHLFILLVTNGRFGQIGDQNKIKLYEPDKDSNHKKNDATISEDDKKFISQFQREYCSIEAIGNGIYCVEKDNKEKLNTVKLVDSKNLTISETFHDMYTVGPLCVTKRWVDGQQFSGLMDKYGKIIIEGKFWILATHIPNYWKKRRRIVFCKDNKFGVINFDGELVIYPKYKNIECIMDDVIVAVNDKGRVVLAEDGTELMTAKFITTNEDKIIISDKDNKSTIIYQYVRKKDFEISRPLAEKILDFTSNEKEYNRFLERDRVRKMIRKERKKTND